MQKNADQWGEGLQLSVLNLTTDVSASRFEAPLPHGFAGHALDVFP